MYSAFHDVEIDDGSFAAWLFRLDSYDSRIIASENPHWGQGEAIVPQRTRSDYDSRPGPEPNHEESQEL